MAKSELQKFIVFKVLEYYWGLPIDSVLRIVNCSLDANQELIRMGMIQIGRHVIRALDLHQRITSGAFPQASANSPFLVITRSSGGELCGIPVDEAPDLMEVSVEMLQPLPASNSQVGLTNIACGVVLSPEEQNPKTIFLLDIIRALNASPPESRSLPPNPVGIGVEYSPLA
ncbi:MAG: chemotaxis protein CheW [Leptolyngbyaceae cyanobacterium MO_188.B28]|nr:chemotaxis protein CheW [Leptolyngbyaceae cyanobacterium MO_188.B28]